MQRCRDVRFSSRRLRPSKEHHAVLRLSAGTTTLKIILSGTKSGLNESVCGQIGEIKIAGISGWTKEPPADNWIVSFEGHDKRSKMNTVWDMNTRRGR